MPHKSRESIDEQQRQMMGTGIANTRELANARERLKRLKQVYFPGDKFPKIRFESGEEAWLRYENEEFLFLTFEDLTQDVRAKSEMPKFKIISKPK